MWTSLAGLPRHLRYTRRLLTSVLPRVEEELARWEARAAAIPDPELRRQALASQRLKRFHAQGGAAFALLAPAWTDQLVTAIVALQTISDYLDNLCDRSGPPVEEDFRQLHQATLAAVRVTGGAPPPAYYARHPRHADGGYLEALVEACRGALASLPAFPAVEAHATRLLSLYNDLQVLKHLEWPRRVPALEAWFAGHRSRYPDLQWWEFAAACGSTLGVFALFGLAARSEPHEAARLLEAYFPWVCGLHILLDYFVDQTEDLAGNDLNLVSYYPDQQTLLQRLCWFLRTACHRVARLPQPDFHAWVVHGLPALYLSDPKVAHQDLQPLAGALLKAGGPPTRLLHHVCRLQRGLSLRPRT